jgi:hypothetical protein
LLYFVTEVVFVRFRAPLPIVSIDDL